MDIFTKLADLRRQNVSAVLCTVVFTMGSTPRKAGSKMIVLSGGSIFGTIGGGSVEMAVIGEAAGVLSRGEPLLKEYQLEEDLSMQCGGSVHVFLEPVLSEPRLIIFGAGHVGRAVGQLASGLGFRVVFFDDRQGIYDSFVCDGAEKLTGNYYTMIAEFDFCESDYLVITTPKHEHDENILLAVARKPHTYLGMIGSKRKVAEVRKRLISSGELSAEELDRVNMPIGIPFAAETPEEIAVSIVAKLIDVKNSMRSQ